MKISALAVSDRGQALAERLRETANTEISVLRCAPDALASQAPQVSENEVLFLLCPVPEAVAFSANIFNQDNHLKAIIQIDEYAKYVVPLAPADSRYVLALAREVAASLGAIPVLSEPEQLESFAIDRWARDAGLRIANPEAVNAVKEKLLSGESVSYNSIFPIAGALPPGIREAHDWEKCDFAVSFLSGFDAQTLLLVPPVLSLGLDGSPADAAVSLEDALNAFLADCGFHPLALNAVCCRADSPLLSQAQPLSEKLGIRLALFDSETLAAGEAHFAQTRYPYFPENECEKCAVLGMDGALLIRRTEQAGIGFALAVLEPQEH